MAQFDLLGNPLPEEETDLLGNPIQRQQAQGDTPGLGGRIVNVGGDVLRRVTGVLEPLQLPQDVLFNAIAAAQDEDLSFSEAFGRMQWRDYAPQIGFGIGGGTPERFVSGSDLLAGWGVQNETVRNWAGFALDLTADPLIAGAWVRGLGKAAAGGGRLLGAGESADDVVRASRQVGGWLDSVVAPATYGRAIGRMPSPYTQQRVSDDVEAVVNFVSNWQPTRTFAGVKASEALTIGDLFRQPVNALQSQLGSAGRALGMSRIRGQAQGAAIQDEVLRTLDSVDTMLGGKGVGRTWLQNVFDAIGRKPVVERFVSDAPESVRDAILSSAYDLSEQASPVLLANLQDVRPRGRSMNDFVRELTRVRGEATPGMQLQYAEARSDALRRVRDAAENAGFDTAEAERLFRTVSGELARADAMIGYHLSMYEPIKANFVSNFELATGDTGRGVEAWQALIRHRWQNPGQRVGDITELGGVAVSDMTGGAYKTLGDFLENDEFLGSLNFDTYLDSLRKGHMRRSYGMFMSPEGYDHYLGLAERQHLFPNHVFDEQQVPRQLASAGFTREAELIDSYMRNVAPAGRTRGGVVTHDRLMRYLVDENNIDPERAQGAMFELIRSMQSPAYGRFLDRVEDAVGEYNQLLRSPPGTPGVGRLAERQELAQDQLEVLMELANPLVSLAESAQMVGRYVPQQEFLTTAARLGRENGWLRKERPDETWERWGDKILGPMSQYYMHPFLAKEVRRGLIEGGERAGIVQRLKRNLTGGFLASPKSVTANVAGGILTTAGLGIEPDLMVREMTRNLPDMIRAFRDPEFVFDELDELSQFVDVGASSMVRQNVMNPDDMIRNVQDRLVDARGGGMSAHLEAMSDAYRNALGLAGLEAFQGTEAWMKVSAFTAAKRMGYSVEEAAELARLSTFDYSQLPATLDWAQNKGVALFPGFPYFMAGRVIGTTLERPGVMAVADRVTQSLTDAALDEETKGAWYAATKNTWMDDEGMAPLPFWATREGAEGSTVVRGFPIQQVFPTDFTNLSVPMAEGIMTLGLWGPLVDGAWALSGHFTGRDTSGESAFYQQYGRRVFSEGASTPDALRDFMGYMYNSYAPAFARGTITFDPDTGPTGGIAGNLYESMFPVPEPLVERGMSFSEAMSGREARTAGEDFASLLLRTIQPVAVDGPLAQLPRNVQIARSQLEAQIRTKQQQIREARTDAARERLRQEALDLVREFREEWGPVMQYHRQTQPQ